MEYDQTDILSYKGGKMTTLKQIRVKLGLTQKQIASAVGISERQYIRIESCERIPNVKTAFQISQCLKSSVEECFVDILT